MKKIYYREFYGGSAIISERQDKKFSVVCRGRSGYILKKSIHANESAAKSALYRYGDGAYAQVRIEN